MITGEVEQTLKEVARVFVDGKDSRQEIAGLAYMEEGMVRRPDAENRSRIWIRCRMPRGTWWIWNLIARRGGGLTGISR